jgi:hypothetical protein
MRPASSQKAASVPPGCIADPVSVQQGQGDRAEADGEGERG